MSHTRTAYRQALAAEIGGYARAVAIGTDGDAATLAITAALSTELPTSAMAYQWVYVSSSPGPIQARIKKTGLNGATGVITLEKSLVTEPVSGTILELHSRLPAIADDQRPAGVLSVAECVNLALRSILVEDDSIELSLVSGQRSYDLTSRTWLDRSSRLVDIRQPDATGGSYVTTPKLWELRPGRGGAQLFFQTPFRFASGAPTARLVALRPGDTLVKIGGTWTETSGGGLTNDAYEGDVPIRDVVTVGLAFAYRTLRDNRSGATRDKYAELYAEQVGEARRVRNYDLDADPFADVPKQEAA